MSERGVRKIGSEESGSKRESGKGVKNWTEEDKYWEEEKK